MIQIRVLAAASLCLLTASAALAQGYPSKPIHLMIGYAPGGAAEAGADKALLAQINATGCDTEIMSPEKTIERIKTDYEKGGRVVKEANIKAD